MTKSIFITSGNEGPRWLPPPGPALITWRPTGTLLRSDEMHGELFLNFHLTARGNKRQHKQTFLLISSEITTGDELYDQGKECFVLVTRQPPPPLLSRLLRGGFGSATGRNTFNCVVAYITSNSQWQHCSQPKLATYLTNGA